MPRWAKVVIWTAVFAACAGAGAYVAAHTDPFPPGVDDPGARGEPLPEPSVDPTETQPPEVQRRSYLAFLDSETSHSFRVGGSCRGRWRGTFPIRIHPDGSVTGLRSVQPVASSCDFPVAQEKVQLAQLTVEGTDHGARLEVRLRVTGVSPVGAQDLTGFVDTIGSAVFVFRGDAGSADAVVEEPDQRNGTMRSDTSVSLRCATGCED